MAKQKGVHKQTAGNKQKAAKKNKEKEHTDRSLKEEVIGVMIIGLSVLALISMLFDVTGKIGRFISSLLVGLFGFGGYILPLLSVRITLRHIFQKEKVSLKNNVLYAALFVIMLALIHLFSPIEQQETNLFGYIQTLYMAGKWDNGGLIGGVTGNFFYVIVGFTGSIIILLASIISILVLVSRKSFVGFVQEQASDFEEKHEQRKNLQTQEKAVAAEKATEKIEKHLLTVVELEETTLKEKAEEAPILLFTEEMKVNLEKKKKTGKSAGSFYVMPEESVVEPKIFIHQKLDSPGEKTEKYPMEIEEPFYKETDEIVGPIETEDTSITKQKINELIQDRKDIDFFGFEEKEIEKIDEQKIAHKAYKAPSISLLHKGKSTVTKETKAQIITTSRKLEETLKSFGVDAVVKEVSRGPTVTRYELSPGHGVRVSRIANLADDIALSLAATTVRIEAPVPGKSVIGIEIPNKTPEMVPLREVIESPRFFNDPSNISVALGKDIAGDAMVADIAKMPHLLIAGSTGSGKSVCINALIISILYKAGPRDVKMIMIDPKVVELNMYNGIPHLLIPVVTDPAKASNALNWAVREMERRYKVFAELNAKNCEGYNDAMKSLGREDEKMEQIVIIIDELSDLMMSAPKEVEESICRLAQMARAAGIHLVVATQRPSVNVITGLIKANIPSRLAFAVSSGVDSRTVLDQYGAEKLLGKGDMLFHPLGVNKPMRIQGAFVSAKEIEAVVDYVKANNPTIYNEAVEEVINQAVEIDKNDDVDELFQEALDFIATRDRVSISLLQRQFRIGYNRAARMVDEMDQRGFLGPEEGSRPRKVLISTDDFTT